MRSAVARGRRALTFLEVMIVVVILGVMMAIVLPNMRGPRERAALRSAAREIASGGLYARQIAIVQGEETRMIFDKESGEWQMLLAPEPEDKRDRRYFDEMEATTSEEQMRTLPQQVSFAGFITELEEFDREERQILTFYPNGTCSGLAIQVKNKSDKSLTIDFEQATGRPEVYAGEPKTMAEKLKENGIDPTLYGLQDPDFATADAGSRPGEGFYRSAGMNEDERVKYYKDAVERMMERSRNKYYSSSAEGGPGAYYSEAARWGSN